MQNRYLMRRACTLFLAICLVLASRANAQSATQGAVGRRNNPRRQRRSHSERIYQHRERWYRCAVPGEIRRQRVFQGAVARAWDLYGFHRRARLRRLS